MVSVRTFEITIFVLVFFYLIYRVTTQTSSTAGPPPVPDLTVGGTYAGLTNLPDYPVILYPAVNVADGSYTASSFQIQSNAQYPIPGNFTFLNKWSFAQYDRSKVSLLSDNGNEFNDVANAIMGIGAYNQVIGNFPIQAGDRIVFSVLLNSVTDMGTGEEAIGVAPFTANVTEALGSDSVAFYGDGSVWTNNSMVYGGLTPFFGAPGHILDVAVDRVDNKIWFRIDGGAWNG